MNPSSGALSFPLPPKPNHPSLIHVQRTCNPPVWKDGIIPSYASDTYRTHPPKPPRLVGEKSVFPSTHVPDTYPPNHPSLIHVQRTNTPPAWEDGIFPSYASDTYRTHPPKPPRLVGEKSVFPSTHVPDTYPPNHSSLIHVQRTCNPSAWEDGIIPSYASDTYRTHPPKPPRLVGEKSVFPSTYALETYRTQLLITNRCPTYLQPSYLGRRNHPLLRS